MSPVLRKAQRSVKGAVAFDADDVSRRLAIVLRVSAPQKESPAGSVHRLHFIVEWAERRDLSQADLMRLTGANKGTVSRWFSGSVPRDDYIPPLLEALSLEEPADLFRHPDDDWITRFLRGRTTDEIDRIRTMLEVAFPKKVA